jgi:YebC/PmpR family DNA-binding regulatory protein
VQEQRVMSGHSKWATIKRKKAKEDAKRGKAFTSVIKEITIAARVGGGDPSSNPRLRTLLEKAKEINMPIDNTIRAIKRGTGELAGESYEPVTYEGYGPAGVAVMVDTLTDNRNRTVAELRRLFSSKGGNLAETGAVGWMFQRLGAVRIPAHNTSEDQLLELLFDYNITDIQREDDLYAILCDAKSLDQVKNVLEKQGFKIDSAELEWVASNDITLSDDQEKTVFEFLDVLENHDDVKNVYTNVH